VLTIADSEEQIEISAEVSEELLRKCRPVEPFAVHKAAILASGLIRDCADGRTVFDALGGGLELSTQVRNIPKGSGLGTSSILLGALISALYRFFGRGDDNNVIWRKVLLAEQYMCVGGGWQDQVGGMTPGIKLLRSEVGSVQRVSVQPLNISDEVISELESRLVLIYTGQRREAKDIIRQVIWRYLAGIGDTVAVLCDMRTLAERMTKCLENGDIDGFAILLNESCESTERLYDACTNQCIDGIFGAIRDLVCGRMICGAGGGGYLQAVLKRGVTPEELQKRIYDVFGECEIKVQQFRFVRDLPR